MVDIYIFNDMSICNEIDKILTNVFMFIITLIRTQNVTFQIEKFTFDIDDCWALGHLKGYLSIKNLKEVKNINKTKRYLS